MGKRKRGTNKAGTNGSHPTQKRAKIDQPLQNGTEATSLDLEKSPFTETLDGEARRREAKVYELLGSADSDERIASADALITGLLASSETALERHLDHRLFRGLASSRNASRVGFSLVITELLNQLFGSKDLAKSKYPGLTFDKVLNILVEKTTSSGHVPGQEERDCYFGRLFGLQCFVESKVLFDDETRWPKVLELLLEMADKKVWIRSHSAWVIVESLPQMGQDRAEETLQQLSDIGLGKTAEGIGIWMKARSCYPGLKTPAKPWNDPMSPGVLPEVARVLKDNVAQDNGDDAAITKAKQGGWTAQLHFVWDLILATFVGQDAGEKGRKDQLKLFWTTVIDDGLFSKNASDAQKFRGFVIFQKFLQGFATDNPKLARELFTRNLMKCLMNQAAKEDRYLHRAALKSLQSMEKAVQASPELLLPVLKEVLGKHGVYDFDQRTNTKTIENLLQWVTPDDAKTVLKLLRDSVIIAKDNESSDIEKFRQVYAGYVSKLATQAKQVPEASDNDDDAINIAELSVKELAACAYSTQPQFKPDLSDKSREAFRRLLAHTIGKVMQRRDDAEYLCNVVISVEPTAVSMSEEINAEQASALKAMRKWLKAGKKSDDKSGASTGLALLYAIAILQLYDGAPDAISILQDLERCSEKMKSKESGSSELLVEILLSLVSRQSPMMRRIGERVFEIFTSQISAEALNLLIEPLVAEENEKGYQALFENLDDEDVEMDDAEDSGSDEEVDDVEEDEMSEIGSDVEFVTLNGEEAADDEDENEDEDSDEDEDNEQDDANAKELADLDDALAKVLGSHRLDKDKEAESSDNDSDMTDSEMIALDEKLVEVFKQRVKKTGKKKEKKDAKESVIMFKHRVLDLIALYLKHEVTGLQSFLLLPPLLELARTTTAKPLVNKAAAVIDSFAKAAKKARSTSTISKDDSDDYDPTAMLALMDDIHAEAAKDPSHAFVRAASAASLLVASSLVADDDEDLVDYVNQGYATTFARCQRGEAKIPGLFFTDWINWGMGRAANANAGAGSGGVGGTGEAGGQV
ncbi:DNA polymerase phi-domain-containing protein [Annulohypoxylon maeteangense]|uniref:DNA polymerase phi-domain-containing protein n=1 Tax=Annulohypoxylon maeteangense TaxID=1927788 RepID=UPI0020073677|nr:DNA polymerase phi-domain-containing protein [Annulohypoxylon maeteangense]KAI0889623.1 DNA polymerase phi-domain-containing protein [Annulohypoxylon maeteangense]